MLTPSEKQFALLAFSSLFSVINPISAAPIFVALILLAAPAIVAWIGPTGQRIVSKIMGLITAVIGIQFVINGVTTVFVSILKSSRS
jgi:small neutral amino acid transporter SnatA (MarC family)